MKKFVWLIVGVLIAGVALGGISIVYASNSSSGSTNSSLGSFVRKAFGHRGEGLDVKALDTDIANFLGITVDQLKTERDSGKSLATIATEHSKTEDALIQLIVTKETANLDTLLKDGKITQTQHDTMISNLSTRVKDMVERTETGRPGLRGEGLDVKALDTDIANFLGITVDQLKTERDSGKSLATIATEHSKTEDALIQLIVTKETANLDTLLKDGKITQTQHDTMISNLSTRVKDMVERTETGRPGLRGKGRMGGKCPATLPNNP